MGVACLKLEGRMKRPEYVAVVTGIYARLLAERRGPTAAETAELEEAFSRSGFTDAYWRGRHGPEMFGARPENAPEPEELFARARTTYEKDDRRTVPVDFSCSVTAGDPCALTASDPDGHTVTVTGPVPEAARTRPLDGLELEARLRKTGGTAYRAGTVVTLVDEGLSLPASAVNDLRRRALAALTDARTAVPARREEPLPPLPDIDCAAEAPALTVSLARLGSCPPPCWRSAPARVYLPLEELADLEALPDGGTAWCAIAAPGVAGPGRGGAAAPAGPGPVPGRHRRPAGQPGPPGPGPGHGAAPVRRLRPQRLQRPVPGLPPGQGARLRLPVL